MEPMIYFNTIILRNFETKNENRRRGFEKEKIRKEESPSNKEETYVSSLWLLEETEMMLMVEILPPLTRVEVTLLDESPIPECVHNPEE